MVVDLRTIIGPPLLDGHDDHAPPGRVAPSTHYKFVGLPCRLDRCRHSARQSGVDQSVISRLESGETQAVSFKNLEKLADALACDPGYLVLKR